jgi:hypothetical protein
MRQTEINVTLRLTVRRPARLDVDPFLGLKNEIHSELYLKIQFVPHSKHSRMGHKNQSVNAVYENNCYLFREP